MGKGLSSPSEPAGAQLAACRAGHWRIGHAAEATETSVQLLLKF